MNILEKLNPIFQEVFDDETITVTPDMTANDVDAWDSLSHVNLVVAIEKEFKIRFALGELEELRSVGDMLNLIKKKIA